MSSVECSLDLARRHEGAECGVEQKLRGPEAALSRVPTRGQGLLLELPGYCTRYWLHCCLIRGLL